MPAFLLLLLQMGVVLSAARVVGRVFRAFGQPQVVGEMAAGLLLGPSALGALAPGISAGLFPPDSLPLLGTLSQIGLLLFMFLVGVELEPALLRHRSHTAVLASHASITIPFFLGTLVALALYPRVSDSSVSFTGFALFMGAAMSVTAFPVLARILTERRLVGTPLGAVAVACAAVDDVTAWSILAAVVLIVRSRAGALALWATIAGTAAFIGAMLLVVRPALARLGRSARSAGRLTQDQTALLLLLLLASAWSTEALGIHALFGAFLFGAVVPREAAVVQDLTRKLEDFTVVFLLPLFFAFTGLRTRIGLLDRPELWGYAGLILVVAVAGKLGGSALGARLTGMGWRDSLSLGVLMNTRGLMELVILNVGLEIGAISPAVFAMMVIMALLTTLMTSPALMWLRPAGLAGAPVPDRPGNRA
ncbi:MAG TPA: cation:proton antiporter [Longimicrobiales bacterium]|nr:cation:proton antiporter [Longimicrobiales bacterium]